MPEVQQTRIMHRRRLLRHASVGGMSPSPVEPITFVKRRTHSYDSGFEDPLKRFEYLRNGKPSAVMIRATPNSVRWDEINRVQYRFQALNFHSDVLEALIHNSPPLSRRERALTIPSKKVNQTNSRSIDSESEKKDQDHVMHARVKCIRRSASFDASNALKNEYLNKRKGSVVQILKDDTSDYNSDEDVFPKSENGSLEKINYNATLCHVDNRNITDTTQIQVTHFLPEGNTNKTDISSSLVDDSERPICASTSDKYQYSMLQKKSDDDDGLSGKTKKELIMMVKQLQGQLSHTENENLMESPTILSPKESFCSSLSSNQERIGDENSENPTFSVSVLISNFEKTKANSRRSGTKFQLSPISTVGRVRTLSRSFENETKKSSSLPVSPIVGKRFESRSFDSTH